MSKNVGKIISISGPVVKAVEVNNAKINDIVSVGNEELLGEIIELRGEETVIQVYEETDGIKPGEPVKNTEMPLSVELAPGLLTQTYDGIQRPLRLIQDHEGDFIKRGIKVDSLDKKKQWDFKPTVKKGDVVSEGMVLGEVQETSFITHKILVPPKVSGKITAISKGKKTILDVIAEVDGKKITMLQKWPVRKSRPVKEILRTDIPLITGRRVLDMFSPLTKGGQAAIPGPFGSGKTVTQQSLAKFCDAQIIVYIGCGERGNEMTEVLTEFPELKDPHTGGPLMDRTILIANTSNMPVAAREASIYTGITIAEYYRDMGYDVALMADSTSRWAEAMREISGRLEEMPGEEGYPAYLANKLSQFYERAGRFETMSGKSGSISIVGAVSPAGGDFSEPVTQNTLKIIKTFWALDAALSAKKHFPAINWLQSYSQYMEETDTWFDANVDKEWSTLRKDCMRLLQQESSLLDLAQLIGKDSLPHKEQFILLFARLIREDYLQQDAFDDNDEDCPLEKQFLMLKALMTFYNIYLQKVLDDEMTIDELESSDVVAKLGKMKYGSLKNDAYKKEIKTLIKDMEKAQ